MTTTPPSAGAPGPNGRTSRQRTLAHLRAAGATSALDGIADQIQRMFVPAGDRLTEQIDGLFRDAMAPIREQINEMFRDAVPPIGPGWSAQIADMLSTGSRRDLFTFLDRFDDLARNNPVLDALLPEDTDAGLGEIGENGLAFVNAEGAGLSWEMQRRLFQAFVLLTVFGALMTAVVSSETASGVLEDAAVPSTVATAALLAATRKWDEEFPQPDGDGEADSDAE